MSKNKMQAQFHLREFHFKLREESYSSGECQKLSNMKTDSY